ncbi:MAG: flagellar biosynthesis protein FlgD [Gemmatimonadetes bacterium]|nr:flagellar biosynthesis protein FlgD [Gemmatimonadota bacterium]|tara:strand:- start:2405 stop:3091 length:687 start_codon:yes stop_codon:yes gene_type:complete
MSVGITSSTTQADAAISQALNSDQELGRDAFLRLLTVQLQNQDPLEPVKNEDFVAQLAQFSSLEQLTLINENIEDDAGTEATTDVRTAVDANTAVALIGREVQVPSDTIAYTGEGSVRLGYNVEGPSDVVRLRIVDQNGTIVNTLVDGSPEQGNASIIWDGKDAEGKQADSGIYGIVPSATYLGVPSPVSAGTAGIVTGVRYQDGQPILITDEGEAPLSAISRVSEGS